MNRAIGRGPLPSPFLRLPRLVALPAPRQPGVGSRASSQAGLPGGGCIYMVGRTLGHCRILEQIGAGGMGEVYRAHDDRLDRDVAVKVLCPGLLADEGARQRFRKEALLLAKLTHPDIASVQDFGTHEGTDFLVMEYIEGRR